MSKEPKESGRNVLQTIREIKERTLDPKNLSPEDRRDCVGHVMGEGLSVPETAELLKVSERTIRRDRKALQEEGAIERDPRLAGVFAGRLIAEADGCVQRLRRITRDKDAPHAVRVEGERARFSIFRDLTQLLQSMGFLPTAAQDLNATLHHVVDEIPRLEELSGELDDLSLALKRTGDEKSEEAKRVTEIAGELERAKLASQTADVTQQIEEKHRAINKD